MRFFMCLQVPTFGEALAASQALVRSLACVPPLVDLERARTHEGLAALSARKRPFARMPPLMVR